MEHREIVVRRTARYALSASPGPDTTDVWFACHGYGQVAGRFLESLRPAYSSGRVIVAPEGLSRFYLDGGTGRVGASWMTREGRESEIRDYLAFLDAVREEVTRSLPRAPRVSVVGFSQGSATAFRWAVQGPARPDRLILWGGGVPGDHDPGRSRAALAGTAVTLVTGTRDEYTPPEALERDAEALRTLGLKVDLVVFEGGHTIDEGTLRQVAG